MQPDPKRFRLVLTTAGSDEQALTIARALVERRLAACVNVLHGACSVYRWQGKIEEEEERVLLIKTDEARFPRVRDAIREVHSYAVPEVLAIPIADGDRDYLAWLAQAIADDG
jgi:periplasmic divalent cation tolerance protein